MPVGYKRKRVARKVSAFRKKMRASSKLTVLHRSRPRMGLMGKHVHLFKRYGQNLANDSFTGESSKSLTFSLDKVQSYSELVSLYDQYKINKVVVKFRLVNVPDSGLVYAPGTNTGTYQSTNFYPSIFYYRDHDSSTTKTLAQLREIGKAKQKVLRPNQVVSISIKPSVLAQMYNTAVSAAYAPKWNQKIDCTNSDTPHYSLVYTYDTMNKSSTTAFEVQVQTIYYLSMYNSR